MPSYLAAALRNDGARTMAQGVRSTFALRPVAAWPVNEIVLQSLVFGGKDTAQIAAQYGVSVEQVSGLRRAYDL